MPRTAALAAGALLAGGASAWPTCNVLDYGAKGSGNVYDTAAVRAALDDCGRQGGGTVLLPAGYTFLSGPVNVSANTELRVEGTLLGSPNNTGYVLVDPLPWYGPDPSVANSSDVREWQPFVASWFADNVTITGGGVIDGNGWEWWPCASDVTLFPCSGHIRPHGVRLLGGSGHHIYNLTIRNSPMWQTHLSFVTDVHVHDINVTAPPSTDPQHPAHNTDGIDPDCAQNVLIERVYISTGDDCIAVKSGKDWFGRTYGRPSANITIRNSVFGNGHGLSIGSEMSGGVYNVTFANLTATGTGTGIRIKSQRGRGGRVSGITYSNISLTGIQGEAIQMTMNYSPSLPPTNATATPTLEGVIVHNVTVNGAKQGWFLDGLPESPLRSLAFSGVRMSGVDSRKYIVACDNVTASTCDAASVTPSCPPCLTPDA